MCKPFVQYKSKEVTRLNPYGFLVSYNIICIMVNFELEPIYNFYTYALDLLMLIFIFYFLLGSASSI